jgi:uncharacterized protein YgbK (DUF1537 family)
MPRYLIQRNFGQRDDDEMQVIGLDTKRIIIEHCPDIVWEISHVVSDETGEVKTFCIYTAPSEDRVREHGDLLGRHLIDAIYEIGGQVSPADFPA